MTYFPTLRIICEKMLRETGSYFKNHLVWLEKNVSVEYDYYDDW